MGVSGDYTYRRKKKEEHVIGVPVLIVLLACLKGSKNEGEKFPSSAHDDYPCIGLKKLLARTILRKSSLY